MRHLVLAVAVFTFVLVLEVQSAPRCSIKGTPNADVLMGRPTRDVICARAGNDYVDSDTGRDVIRGGLGDDTLDARDEEGNDIIRGDGGHDTCMKDKGDQVRSCEVIIK